MGIYPHGLIGNHITVLDSTNKMFVGLEGMILDESKELLHISFRQKKRVKLLKRSLLRIKLHLPFGEELELSLNEFYGRTSDRIKG